MLRRTIPALGLLALLIAFGQAPRPAFAQAHEKSPETAAEKEEKAFGKAAESHEPSHEGADLDHGKSPNIMEVQSPLAIWTLVVFGCLLLVLGKFAWSPLMKALHEREAHLEQVLYDSEKARNEAEAMAAQHRKELAKAADEVRALIEEARKEAQASANTILQKAQADAEESRKRAEREIAGAKDQALMEIWSKTADLAVSVAGKVLSKELGESDHKRLIDLAMSELPSNGEGARA